MKGVYIKNFDNELVEVKEGLEFDGCVYCGLYAAVGWIEENAGNLYAVFSTPILVPAYDKKGKRLNVGKEKAGMSYSERRGWYYE